MASHPVSSVHTGGPSPISIPFVVLAAILIGAGLLLLFTWLLTFSWQWFVGVLPVTIGTLMLFDRRAGADAAAPA